MKFAPSRLFAALLCLGLAAFSPSRAETLGERIAAQPDRIEKDRKEDAQRQPAKFLDFVEARPGMKALDIMAGGGYTAELLARAAGPTGQVWGHNAPDRPDRVVFANRLETKAMANAHHFISPIDEPIPAGLHDLDLVTFVLNYHDTVYLPVDRAKMNKAVFDGLKHGGLYVIVDHSARPGDGITVGQTLHRIEEASVVREVEAVGFQKIAEGGYLRHPEDSRDQAFFDRAEPTDRFVLKFRKP